MKFSKVLRLAVCLILLVGWTLPLQAADDALNLDVREFTLPNGMLFLVVERHTTPQVACRLAIRAGSALEEAGKTGIAHMLEHMMFKGTANFGTRDPEKDRALQEEIESAAQVILAEERKRHPDPAVIAAAEEKMTRLRQEVQKIYVPQAFSSQLGRNGAVGVNAFTTKDQTQYMMSIPSDMIEQWFSIVSEQLFEPSWREFYVEKAVVQREWAFRYVNNPNGAAFLDLDATAYTAHPYRNPVIGWRSDMDRFNTTDAMAFHRRYYAPANAVAVLVGDITVEAAKRLADTYFGRYPAGNRSPESVTEEPPQNGPRKRVRFLEGARTPIVRVGFHAPAMGTRDFYALDAMTMIMSVGRSARLSQEIVDKGKAVSAWAYNPDNRYGTLLVLGGSPNDPPEIETAALSDSEKRDAYVTACESLTTLLLEQVERFKTETVSTAELERIKKLNRYEFLERLRNNENLAATLATLEVQIGWRYINGYLDEIARVTPQEIREAARRYIRSDNRTTVFVVPGGEPETPPEPYAEIRSIGTIGTDRLSLPKDLSNHSRYPTPEGWQHPLSFKRSPQKIEYPPAIRGAAGPVPVFYLPDRELPLVKLTLLAKAGAVDVPEEKIGLGALVESTLVKGGTQRHSPEKFARLLDDNAIHLSVSVGEEETAISLSAMTEDWRTGIDLLAEVLSQPAFAGGVLDAAKSREMSAIRRQSDDAQSVSFREGMAWHFKGHVYGRDPLQALATIPSLDAQDLKAFVGRYIVPGNLIACISGDLSLDEALAGLEKVVAALPDSPAPGRQLVAPPATPPVLAFIDKPGQSQAQVGMFLPSVPRTDPSYWDINLLMSIFGGSDSLLYTRLRDDLGLVYTAGFTQVYKWEAGFLAGWMGSRGDMTPRAISEAVATMVRLREEIPEGEFELKKLDALNSFVFNVDTPEALLGVYGRYYLRGEPLDTLERIQEAFIEASRDSLLDLARRFLDPDKLQIFVTGDRATLVHREDGSKVPLDQELKSLAGRLGLPYEEIALR